MIQCWISHFFLIFSLFTSCDAKIRVSDESRNYDSADIGLLRNMINHMEQRLKKLEAGLGDDSDSRGL